MLYHALEDRCGCVSCSDESGEDRTERCDQCGGIMRNTRVVCYDGNSNGIGQQWVTKHKDPWTSDHGWSQCKDCQNIGGYIS